MNLKNKLFLVLISLFSLSNFLTAQNFYVQEDFNAGSLPSGWSLDTITGSNSWQFGIDGSAEPGNNNIDATNFVYFDDGALGPSSNNTVALVSPSFNNQTSPATFLTFDYNFRSAFVGDSLYVEVFDGTSWNYVWGTAKINDCGRYVRTPNPSLCQLNGFPNALINISAYADTNCQVRIVYHDGNDWGWYAGLDNIEIYSPALTDIGVVSIENPKTNSCGLSSNELISCTIVNFSSDTINNFEVVALVDNGAHQVIDTINSTLLPFDSLQYTFTKGVDLSLSKAYAISVFTRLSLDTILINDSSLASIPFRSIKLLPYEEGFENSTHGWEASGTNSSWELGAPNNTYISQAALGKNAFVTNLNGDYNSAEFSYLNSPCISLDTASSKYLVSVDLKYDLERIFDASWLEYSIDDGVQWQKVTSSLIPLNWYNRVAQQLWDGNNSDWVKYATLITTNQTSSSIKFRFIMRADNSNQKEGVGVDNFSIRAIENSDLTLNLLSPKLLLSKECGLSSSENVSVELINIGTSPVDSIKLAYQIDNNPAVSATINNLIQADSTLIYNFTSTANLKSRTTYLLRLFLEYPNSGGITYDTISLNINNEYYHQESLPYLETFDDMREISDFVNSSTYSDSLSIAWNRNPDLPTNKRYMWVVAKDSAFSGVKGPLADHTGNNGNYLASVRVGFSGSANNFIATISSPCISINSSNPELSFWYHRYNVGTVAPLYVDVLSDNTWNYSIDSISASVPANNSDSFIQHTVDLSSFQSKKIKLRFRQNTPLGYYRTAIDDINVYDSLLITGIPKSASKQQAFLLYPNPNHGEFTLKVKPELVGSQFEVYNMAGQLILAENLVQNKIELNLNEYGKGVYFVRFPMLNLSEKLVVY